MSSIGLQWVLRFIVVGVFEKAIRMKCCFRGKRATAYIRNAMHESWFLRLGSQCISILIRRTTTQKHTIQIQIQRARLIIIPDYCHRSEQWVNTEFIIFRSLRATAPYLLSHISLLLQPSFVPVLPSQSLCIIICVCLFAEEWKKRSQSQWKWECEEKDAKS